MNFKKRVNGSWTNIPHYIHDTATDTLTTLPTVLYPNAATATVGLKGNTVQNGTPTPDNPIQPQETGERTGNLADLYNANVSRIGLTFSATDNMRIVINGTKTTGANIISIKNSNIVLPAGTYTVKIKMVSGEITGLTSDGIMFGINASTYEQRTSVVTKVGEIGKRTFTLSEDTIISSFDITPSYSSVGAIFDNATFECWFYAGSDDKPYEPYGYKIPISSANTTTPVYLGDVETTRRVKKLVLTGEETSWYTSKGFIYNDTIQPDYLRSTAITLICSHYKAIAGVSEGLQVSNGQCALYKLAGIQRLYIKDNNYTSIDDFKSYLAAQYAAGTPVTVWYVLTEPETGIVNEPLMKIGDYADTVSGITIPTITGKDTVDVETTLKPSEVSLSYTGWHDVDVKEWDGSDWQ